MVKRKPKDCEAYIQNAIIRSLNITMSVEGSSGFLIGQRSLEQSQSIEWTRNKTQSRRTKTMAVLRDECCLFCLKVDNDPRVPYISCKGNTVVKTRA